jgi:PKD repeat protein
LNFENKGVCGNLIQEILISGENYTNASLSTNVESVDLNISESIELTPSPENGSIISIDFGDGVRLEGISQKESIQHQYKSEGNFTIRIVSVNGNCSDAKEIPVSVSNNELFAVKQLDNELQLLYNFENPTNVEMQIVNSLGAIVFESNLNGLKTGKQNLSIANYKPGVYFVSFSYDQKMVTRKIVK